MPRKELGTETNDYTIEEIQHGKKQNAQSRNCTGFDPETVPRKRLIGPETVLSERSIDPETVPIRNFTQSRNWTSYKLPMVTRYEAIKNDLSA